MVVLWLSLYTAFTVLSNSEARCPTLFIGCVFKVFFIQTRVEPQGYPSPAPLYRLYPKHALSISPDDLTSQNVVSLHFIPILAY